MSGKSRYDRYIPLFGRLNGPTDYRVRFFLANLEDIANESRRGRDFQSADVALTKKTNQMENRYFFNHDSNKSDTGINSEWPLFVYQMAKQLANRVVTVDSDKNSAVKVLPVVHSLQNAPSGSLDQLVWVLLTKVAVVSDAAGNRLNQSGAAQATRVEYLKTPAEIIAQVVPGTLFFEDATKPVLLAYNAIGYTAAELAAMDPQTQAHREQIVKNVKNPNYVPRLLAASDVAAFTAELVRYVDNVVVNEFSYNLTEFVINSWLEDAVKQPMEDDSSSFFDDIEENKYFRDANGLLRERDGSVDGKEIHMGSANFKKLVHINNKCMTTGLPMESKPDAHGNVVTCAEYLSECLQGNSNGVAKCKKFMQHENFWENAKKEAETILPAIILRTLSAFGFEREQYVHSETKQTLWRVQTYEQWISSLNNLTKNTSNNLSADEVKNIAGNSKLGGYLAMLVKRINENPIILNENLAVGSNKTKPAIKLNVGLLPKYGLILHAPANDIMSTVERTNNTMMNHVHGNVRLAAVVPIQLGGNNNKYFNPIERYTNLMKYPVKHTWSIMERQYKGLAERLRQYRKSISSDDHSLITKLIKQLKDAETKLIKVMLYGEKYAKLLEVFGQDDGKSILKLAHLQKFVDAKDSYLNKVKERQNSLTSIIRTVAEAVAKEVNNKQVDNMNVQHDLLSNHHFNA
jgi:hypothetical protein